MDAICDTSPLIFLVKIGRINVLQKLYTSISIPPAVQSELYTNLSSDEILIRELIKQGSITVVTASPQSLEMVPEELGSGEEEALALMHDMHRAILITDDSQARTYCRAHSFQVTGTIGVLVEAYYRKIIPPSEDDIDHLIEAGMWLSEPFYHRIINEIEKMRNEI